MKKYRSAFRAAFPHTLPVMAGYLFLGLAFGVLLANKGYGWGWGLLCSLVVYAGSMQFVLVSLLVTAFDPFYAFLLTLMVNARHLFYGVSMLREFEGAGLKKPYLIFGLTDETFSLLCSEKPPDGVDKHRFQLAVTLLDQLYWLAGTLAGGLAGAFLPFPTTGIDFVMTALFTVIVIDQWKATQNHIPALAGLGVSVLSLLLFGVSNFLPPAMLGICAVLLFARPLCEKCEKKGDKPV
ncbi:MAG: AzlC family ABC transporter permease [Oscillospiraceae bacterium]|nr:AzlC family ABC transporter permease [Oscillospiraceae bacterium]